MFDRVNASARRRRICRLRAAAPQSYSSSSRVQRQECLMITREAVASKVPTRDLSLQSGPNWTAVIFLATLSALHYGISIHAFLNARWEGAVSFMLANAFLLASIGAYLARYELVILPQQRRICMRTGIGPLRFQRSVPFSAVHAVRLTMAGAVRDAQIEMLCDNEDIRCPPTTIPRQQALFLAILIGVELIKVCTDASVRSSDRAL
jgi:hypothetical protein